jgi:hypothetical protein
MEHQLTSEIVPETEEEINQEHAIDIPENSGANHGQLQVQGPPCDERQGQHQYAQHTEVPTKSGSAAGPEHHGLSIPKAPTVPVS